MNKLKQTYRFLSAALLITMASNIILPAGFAMGRYLCDADEMHHAGSAVHSDGFCLHHSEADPYGKNIEDLSDDICYLDQVCNQALTDSEPEGLIPSTSSNYLIAFTASLTVLQVPFQWDLRYLSTLETSVSLSTLPLFLLNSTFLN